MLANKYTNFVHIKFVNACNDKEKTEFFPIFASS